MLFSLFLFPPSLYFSFIFSYFLSQFLLSLPLHLHSLTLQVSIPSPYSLLFSLSLFHAQISFLISPHPYPYFNLRIAEKKKISILSPVLTLSAFMTQCEVDKYVLRLSLGDLNISFQSHQHFLSIKNKSYKLRLSLLSTSPTFMN